MLRYYTRFLNDLRCNIYHSRSITKNIENLSNFQKTNCKPSEVIKYSIPIEKKSLSCGMALNMFEKVNDYENLINIQYFFRIF